MENETAITPQEETTTRKRYSPLPDDAPKNSLNRKARPKILTKAVLMHMTPMNLYNLKQSAKKAGFPSYASYVRFLSEKVITEDSLIVNVSKKTIRNLQDNAEAMGKSVEDYIRYLANLKVSV